MSEIETNNQDFLEFADNLCQIVEHKSIFDYSGEEQEQEITKLFALFEGFCTEYTKTGYTPEEQAELQRFFEDVDTVTNEEQVEKMLEDCIYAFSTGSEAYLGEAEHV